MRLLLTGGAGFIGSHFVDYVLNKYSDYEIINLDALTYAGSMDNLKDATASTRHRFVRGRIEDAELVDDLMTEVDVIINFAAESHVDRSIAEPQVFLKTNIAGTQVLLDAACRHRISLFYQISTDEVYGDLALDSRDRFVEGSSLKPNSPYAASKAAADLLVTACSRTHGLSVIISRSCNNYGTRQHREKFLPTIITCAANNRPVPVYGDGCYMRDWMHVSDHCRAIDLILHHGKSGHIYNVAASNEWLNTDLVQKVLDMLGRPRSLVQFVKDRPGHDKRYALDSTKIRKELGWLPKVTFEQGLREVISWYCKGDSK